MNESISKRSAWVISDGLLDTIYAKTAHALLRGGNRFLVTGVIDPAHAGKRIGDVVPLAVGEVPIFANFEDAVRQSPSVPECLVVGVATKGGVLPPHLREFARIAIEHGMDIVNGLHEALGDDPVLSEAARTANVKILDIRKPKPFQDLHFWEGKVFEIECPIIAVLGMDCAVGKRTTAARLTEALRGQMRRAEMIYTGQTGWMLGYKYGFIFDATPNDFVTGEMEHALISCWEECRPDVLFLEGQSGLRNPSGPCGPEYLLSARARAVILQHPIGRRHFAGWEALDCEIPSLASELELIRMYGANTIAIALNATNVSPDHSEQTKRDLERELGIPVANPFQDIQPLIDAVTNYCDSFSHTRVYK